MAIFDIDDTILDVSERYRSAKRAGIIGKDGSKPAKGVSWTKRNDFLYSNKMLAKDSVIPNALDLIKHLSKEGFVIAYCTGRPIQHYDKTLQQLKNKGFPIFRGSMGNDLLFLKRRQNESTINYKRGIAEQLGAQYDVRLFFDDEEGGNKKGLLSAVAQAGVPGVYNTIKEYYDMLDVRSNPHGKFGYYSTEKSAHKAYLDMPDPDAPGKTVRETMGPKPKKEKGVQKTFKVEQDPVRSNMAFDISHLQSEQQTKRRAHIDERFDRAKQALTNFDIDYIEGQLSKAVRAEPASSEYRIFLMEPELVTFRSIADELREIIYHSRQIGYTRYTYEDFDLETAAYYVLELLLTKMYKSQSGSRKWRVRIYDENKEGLVLHFDKISSNPAKRGRDSKGPYYRWGKKGKKYYYKAGDAKSRAKAKAAAIKQGKAIHASGGYSNPSHTTGNVEDHPQFRYKCHDCDAIMKPSELAPWPLGTKRRTEHGGQKGACPKCKSVELAGFMIPKLGARTNPSNLLPIMSGEPTGQHKKLGAVFSEVVIGRNIFKDVGEAVQAVYRGLVGGRTSMAEKRLAMGVASMNKELSDRAKALGGNAVGNLKLDYEMVHGAATITIIATADAIKMRSPPKSNPRGGEYMVPRDIHSISQSSDRLEDTYSEFIDYPEWWKSKLSVSASQIDNLADASQYVADNPHLPVTRNNHRCYGDDEEPKNNPQGKYHKYESAVRNILIKEGGAAGFSALKKAFPKSMPLHERETMLQYMPKVVQHQEGDYILVEQIGTQVLGKMDPEVFVELSEIHDKYGTPLSNPVRSNPAKSSKVKKAKKLYEHMNGSEPVKVETKSIDVGDVWYQIGEGGCWSIGYMSGKETGNSAQKYVHNFNEETKDGDFPKLFATMPEKGKPMLIITGGTWKIKTDDKGTAWIYD